jgi:hypothetical protein
VGIGGKGRKRREEEERRVEEGRGGKAKKGQRRAEAGRNLEESTAINFRPGLD